MAQAQDLLKTKLYVFDLPAEILATLQSKSSTSADSEGTTNTELLEVEDAAKTLLTGHVHQSTSCGLCALSFSNVQGQRGHVKSDLHRFNLKQKLRGLEPVGETEFEKLVGDLDESLSGSDSSDSDGGENEESVAEKEDDGTLMALLKRQANIAAPSGEMAPKNRRRGSGRPPLLWFTSPRLPPGASLGIYRAILTNDQQREESQIVQIIRERQLSPKPAPKLGSDTSNGVPLPAGPGPHIFLCMIGGGHFAGMIVALAPKMGKNATGVGQREATVLAHKTFHRYTTRRKQGGAQSSNDAAKGAAHSAGSSLRRYNEGALTNEVRDILGQWKPLISSSELLFVRATGNTNRRTLYGPYDGQVLLQDDPRIRGFPFTTRRATQAELMRAFVELTRVKVSQVDEAALAATAAAQELSASPAKSISKPSAPKRSEEEETTILHTSQLQAMIRRSKAPALLNYLMMNNLSPNFVFYPPQSKQNHHTPTPLHLAASLNSPVIVFALITKAGANPAILNPEGKAAFELAGDRPTRDAFRVARWTLGEQRFDWVQAKVLSSLSKDEADKRDQREKEEDTSRETERRRVETERLRAEDAKKVNDSKMERRGGATLGGGGEKTGAEKREEEARGLTPEMRQKLERERRARAAEERIRRLQGGR